MSDTEIKSLSEDLTFPCSIAPWLSVGNGPRAIDFYCSAFGAIVVYRMEAPDGSLVAKLSVNGAEFWLSSESADNKNISADPSAGKANPVRMILTVSDPDAFFARALLAGASQVFPVGDGHGWRLGRLVDPFGHHWEIGRPLNS